MSGLINLKSANGNVCDAVADPPRLPDNKIPTKIPDVQPPSQDQSNKKEPNPPVNEASEDTATANDAKSDDPKDFKPSASKNNEKSKPAKETSYSKNVNYKFKNCNIVNVGPQKTNVIYLNHVQIHNSGQYNGTKKKEFQEMSAEIQKLSKSEIEITTKDMLVIKKYLGKWEEVAEKLNFTKGEREQLYEDYKSFNTTEIVYQMLLKWQQRDSKAATIGRIVSVMWLCQAYDCVEKLAKSLSDR